MKLTIFGLTVVVGAALIVAGLHGQLDWTSTPAGHAALAWLLFAVLVTVLACLGMRTHIRDRDAREAQEWADLDEWEASMYAGMSDWLDVPVRPVTRAELDAEDERLTTTVVPTPTPAWPPPLTPLQTHRTLADFPPQPMPARELVPYVPDPSWAHIAPMYNGDAGEWRSERLDGAPVVDEQTYASEVLVGLSRSDSRITNHAALAMSQAFGHVVEAMPVSPAPNGRPTSHRRGVAEGTQTQRLKPDFVSWEQADWEQPTGAFPVLVGVGAR